MLIIFSIFLARISLSFSPCAWLLVVEGGGGVLSATVGRRIAVDALIVSGPVPRGGCFCWERRSVSGDGDCAASQRAATRTLEERVGWVEEGEP